VFKDIMHLGSLLKQAQALGGQVGQLGEQMKHCRVTGAAGGGLVEVEVNGMMEVLQCRIDAELFGQNDRELIEDLVVAAVNQAIGKAKQMHAESIRTMTGGLPLPSGFHEALAKFTGTEEEQH
jgi:nucleoid-associated protein EbfC